MKLEKYACMLDFWSDTWAVELQLMIEPVMRIPSKTYLVCFRFSYVTVKKCKRGLFSDMVDGLQISAIVYIDISEIYFLRVNIFNELRFPKHDHWHIRYLQLCVIAKKLRSRALDRSHSETNCISYTSVSHASEIAKNGLVLVMSSRKRVRITHTFNQ